MDKDKVRRWIGMKEISGYIDCDLGFGEDEFDFILEMAKELLKRLEKEND